MTMFYLTSAFRNGFKVTRTITMAATNGRVNNRAEDFRSVLADVVQVVTTTGPRPALMRTFQVPLFQ